MDKDEEIDCNSAEQKALRKSVENKLKRWRKMMQGDEKALIEIMIERGIATKEDFEE